MNEVKHTPGWESTEQVGPPRHCQMAQVFGEDGQALAAVEPTDPPSIASDRARLIAAAPEMLAGIDWALEWIAKAPHDEVCFVNDPNPDACRCVCGKESLLDALSEASDKAKGLTP